MKFKYIGVSIVSVVLFLNSCSSTSNQEVTSQPKGGTTQQASTNEPSALSQVLKFFIDALKVLSSGSSGSSSSGSASSSSSSSSAENKTPAQKTQEKAIAERNAKLIADGWTISSDGRTAIKPVDPAYPNGTKAIKYL